jgi:hypothetical protein
MTSRRSRKKSRQAQQQPAPPPVVRLSPEALLEHLRTEWLTKQDIYYRLLAEHEARPYLSSTPAQLVALEDARKASEDANRAVWDQMRIVNPPNRPISGTEAFNHDTREFQHHDWMQRNQHHFRRF